MDENKKKAIVLGLSALFLIIVFVRLTDLILRNKSSISVNNRIAVVNIFGPMFDSKKVIALLHKYDEDKSISGIIIRLDTPGGGVAVAQEIVKEIYKIKNKGKKIVSSMGSIAASGGYYVACATDRIFANPGTLTGSIGVIMEIPNIEELLRKIGVRIDVVKSGEHKDIGSLSRRLTPEEQRLLQDVIDDVFDQFIEAIVEGRNNILIEKLSLEKKIEKNMVRPEDIKLKIKSIADGRIFSGRQAKEFGLIDELGNFEDTLDWIAKASRISGKPVLVEEKKKLSLFDIIFGEKADSIFQLINGTVPFFQGLSPVMK